MTFTTFVTRVFLPLYRLLFIGVLIPCFTECRAAGSSGEEDSTAAVHRSTDVLPILSYDSNTGYGFGIKSFFLNYLSYQESFDAVAFMSSEGERWLRLVFSVPDFEHRQGTPYTGAFDAAFDYDIQTSYSFFGIGNQARYDDRIFYRRETRDVSLMLSRGFNSQIVGQAGLHLRSVMNSAYPAVSPLGNLPFAGDHSEFTYLSVLLTCRYDSRTSFINPSEGLVLQAEAERSLAAREYTGFTRLGGWIQTYTPVVGKNLILACRGGIQGLVAHDPPAQLLLPIGGGTTVRGYIQDRYLDRISIVVNFETRFRIIWRFSGAAGFDAGKVWHTVGNIDLNLWAANPVAGIRFSFDTFIARLDIGFGPEDTPIYLNFGQLF